MSEDFDLDAYVAEREKAQYAKIEAFMNRILGNVPETLPGRRQQRLILGEEPSVNEYNPLRR